MKKTVLHFTALYCSLKNNFIVPECSFLSPHPNAITKALFWVTFLIYITVQYNSACMYG